jgi:hypothetical protein
MNDSAFFVIKKANLLVAFFNKTQSFSCVACCDASLNNLYPLSLYTIWVKPEQSIPNGVLPPKDKERLNIKMKCLSGAFVFYTIYFTSFKFKTTVFMVSLLINESEAPRGIGISKLEGPVTYSTRKF